MTASLSVLATGASAVFTPPSGSYSSGSTGTSVQRTLNCSTLATWTYSALPTGVTANVGNGGQALSITFTLNGGTGDTATFTAHGDALGVTADYTITLNLISP